jgi:hypothetical protein
MLTIERTQLQHQREVATDSLRYSKALMIELIHLGQNLQSLNKSVVMAAGDLLDMFQAFNKDHEEWMNMCFLKEPSMKTKLKNLMKTFTDMNKLATTIEVSKTTHPEIARWLRALVEKSPAF